MGRGYSKHVVFVFIHILYTSVSLVALKSLSVIVKNWDFRVYIIVFYIHNIHSLTFSENKSEEKTPHPSYNEFKSGSFLVSILTRDLSVLVISYPRIFDRGCYVISCIHIVTVSVKSPPRRTC